MDRRQQDLYEPLPSLPELPMWLWRRATRWRRALIIAAALAIVATAVVLPPEVRKSQREAAERAQRERARERAELVRALEREQSPRLRHSGEIAGLGAASEKQLRSRARMMSEIEDAILRDARRRVRRGELDGSIREVRCARFPSRPGAVGADRDLSVSRGRFACLAITAEFSGGAMGHQYRLVADFSTGRYGFCKITGRAGPERDQVVTIPAACGGDGSGGGD